MHIDQLKYLIEISKCRSLNTASQNLNITYNGLRYSINALEDELGVQLLNRTNKGCTLTKEGEQIVNLSETFLSSLSVVINKKQKNNISGEIMLFLQQFILESFMSKFIFDMEEKYPKLKIKYSIQDSAEILFQKVSQNPDAFYIFPFSNDTYYENFLQRCEMNHIAVHELYTTALYCSCVHSHELAKKKNLTVKQLNKYTILLRSNVEDPLLTHYFNQNSIYVEENAVVFENAVLSGKYIFLTSALPIAPYFKLTHDAIVNIPIMDVPETKICLVHSKKLQPTDHIQVFLHELGRKLNCKLLLEQ